MKTRKGTQVEISNLRAVSTTVTIHTTGDQKKLNPQIPSVFHAINRALAPFMEPEREGKLIIEIEWRPSTIDEIKKELK